MSIELCVPEVGESIHEVQLGKWLKSEGDAVARDEPILEIETDKITVELPAPTDGVLVKRMKLEGDAATVGEVVGMLEEGNGAAAASVGEPGAIAAPAAKAATGSEPSENAGEPRVMPAARRALAEKGLEAKDVKATGPGGRLLKEDVLRHTAAPASAPDGATAGRPAEMQATPPADPSAEAASAAKAEEVVKMSPLRKRLAERLVDAQQTAAILTTFNEIDMGPVMALRKRHGEAFQERYGVKLGFMSFFVKAAIDALRLVPGVNAEIRGDSIVYKNHYDIGVAVGGGKGLVVPIVRGAERLSFAEVEASIADLAARAQTGKLDLEDLQGGTFTISNGGIYGSMMSTPILNPPQSGILGLHAIQDRPMAVDGQVVIRPMMYVALSYDHRLVDGREAVTFLKRVKECVEDPARMLLET